LPRLRVTVVNERPRRICHVDVEGPTDDITAARSAKKFVTQNYHTVEFASILYSLLKPCPHWRVAKIGDYSRPKRRFRKRIRWL